MRKLKFFWMLCCFLLINAGAEAQPKIAAQPQADSLWRVQIRALTDSVAQLQERHELLLDAQKRQALRIEEAENDQMPLILGSLGIIFGLAGLGLAWKTGQALEEVRRKAKQTQPSFNEIAYQRQLDELRSQIQELKKTLEWRPTGQKKTEQFAQPQAEASGMMPSAHEESGQTAMLDQLPEGMGVEAISNPGTQPPAAPAYLQKPMADGAFMPFRELRNNASYFEVNPNTMTFEILHDGEVFDRIRKTGISSILPDSVAQLQEGSLEHWKTLETIQPGRLAKKDNGMLEVLEKMIYRTKN